MDMINFCIILAIIIYLFVMLIIGFIFSKNNEDSTDFYLGGRKMGPLVTAMSAEASDMSSWLLMGFPGLAYLSGICEPFWTALGLGIGTYLNWLFIARRLRRYSDILDAYTVPQFFSKRFHDNKNILSAVSAFVIIIFFIPYTASGFSACGKLFNSLLGINYKLAMITSAIVIAGYTIMGGFKAVSVTDFVQSCIMTLALIIALSYGINAAGGLTNIIKNAKTIPGYLSLYNYYDFNSGIKASYGGKISVISTMAWGLGYFGMPHILLRFMAIKNEKELIFSRRVASVWVFISMIAAILIGIVGLGITRVGLLKRFSTLATAETILVQISNLIAQHGIFAAFMAGVIIAGILASIMSTADSQMLAAASAISENIICEFMGKKIDEKKRILIARVTIVAITILGIIFALNPESSVFYIVSFAWAGFGGSFGPVMLCALFWKRMTREGAFAGIIFGMLTVFIWKFLIKSLGGIFSIYELLPAFLVSFIVIIIVSLITKEPDSAILREFEQSK